jgi:hypothetical protein
MPGWRLPRDRMEVYEAALEMLLVRRDRDRGVELAGTQGSLTIPGDSRPARHVRPARGGSACFQQPGNDQRMVTWCGRRTEPVAGISSAIGTLSSRRESPTMTFKRREAVVDSPVVFSDVRSQLSWQVPCAFPAVMPD